MVVLPTGETGDFCVITGADGVSLLAAEARHGFTDAPIVGGVTIELSVESALLLGHALIEAAKARSN